MTCQRRGAPAGIDDRGWQLDIAPFTNRATLPRAAILSDIWLGFLCAESLALNPRGSGDSRRRFAADLVSRNAGAETSGEWFNVT
jgi:hypothetical protein